MGMNLSARNSARSTMSLSTTSFSCVFVSANLVLTFSPVIRLYNPRKTYHYHSLLTLDTRIERTHASLDRHSSTRTIPRERQRPRPTDGCLPSRAKEQNTNWYAYLVPEGEEYGRLLGEAVVCVFDGVGDYAFAWYVSAVVYLLWSCQS